MSHFLICLLSGEVSEEDEEEAVHESTAKDASSDGANNTSVAAAEQAILYEACRMCLVIMAVRELILSIYWYSASLLTLKDIIYYRRYLRKDLLLCLHLSVSFLLYT